MENELEREGSDGTGQSSDGFLTWWHYWGEGVETRMWGLVEAGYLGCAFEGALSVALVSLFLGCREVRASSLHALLP